MPGSPISRDNNLPDQSSLAIHASHELRGSPLDVTVKHILEALPQPIYMTDDLGRITFFNEAAEQLWGTSPVVGKSQFCGSWRLYTVDGERLSHEQCSIAIALRERRANTGMEAIAERPDGSRVSFVAFPTPLFDAHGEMTGAVSMLIETTGRALVDEVAQRFAAIVESSEDAILSKDMDGRINSWNHGAEMLFGYTAEEAIGQHVTLLIPLERHNEEPDILGRIRLGQRIEHYETIRRRKDGSLVEISLSVSPIRNLDGKIVGASKIARDITEKRRAEEQQQLLIREMDHRVKNLFTLASSVVSLSARSASTTAELASTVKDRLNALAKAHALTVPVDNAIKGNTVRHTTLRTLLDVILAPYNTAFDGARARTVVTGDDTEIAGAAVTSFALLLHEFATNGAKYGALSVPQGQVFISCSVEGDQFILTWVERGGPRVVEPSDKVGFGTVLGKATVQNQLGGNIIREWSAEGLAIRLSVLRDRLRA
jgi:PAS domain S-box-containing protein